MMWLNRRCLAPYFPALTFRVAGCSISGTKLKPSSKFSRWPVHSHDRRKSFRNVKQRKACSEKQPFHADSLQDISCSRGRGWRILGNQLSVGAEYRECSNTGSGRSALTNPMSSETYQPPLSNSAAGRRQMKPWGVIPSHWLIPRRCRRFYVSSCTAPCIFKSVEVRWEEKLGIFTLFSNSEYWDLHSVHSIVVFFTTFAIRQIYGKQNNTLMRYLLFLPLAWKIPDAEKIHKWGNH